MVVHMSKYKAPKMVYISGEEMTRVFMQDVLDKWLSPWLDMSNWQFFDLSCQSRDATDDKVLHDAIAAGVKTGVIFKEPTITPQQEQVVAMGLKKTYPSPNGPMRAGFNGFTISRDTIMLGGKSKYYSRPVFFDRHAVGGEYGAKFSFVQGRGKMVTMFYQEGASEGQVLFSKELHDEKSAIVSYDIPLSGVQHQAHHFFSRCLAAKIVPYITTKRTVFKWQEEFWQIAKMIYDQDYKAQFANANVHSYDANGHPTFELSHILTDDATMKLIKWKEGGFGFMSLNYDGDMLSDELGELHAGNPGLMSSVLTGVAPDGTIIQEFEASHGTMANSYKRYTAGQLDKVRIQPMGLLYALNGAVQYACKLALERHEINQQDATAIVEKMQKLYNITGELVLQDALPDYPTLFKQVANLL